jgi:4-methylaminobutanoate oxidase (formaldehyde-forming)
VLSLFGPNARDVLGKVTTDPIDNASFPFATCRRLRVAGAPVIALRVTYVGELGWELLVPSDQAAHVYRTIAEAGKNFELTHAGYHALNSLRMEKAYRSWGHDIGGNDTPLEAGLGFAVAWDKGDFIGRDALVAQRTAGLDRVLVQFAFADPEVLAFHDEPIYRDGVMVGKVASATYGHTLRSAVALGYLSAQAGATAGAEWVAAGSYEVEVANRRQPVRASMRPFYDPSSTRVRA